MAILQALRPKTLTRSIVFAALCLIVAGAAVLVWMLQYNDVTDGGQELTGYFKNGHIQKITYSVGMSLGLQRYLYYFDSGELVHVSAEEDDYPATNEGLDYEKTEPVFSGEYFFLNGKLLRTSSKGQGRYLSASTTNAGDGLMASATRYMVLLSK